MKLFYTVFGCMVVVAIFYWLLVSPLYRKVNAEKKILSAVNNEVHKEKNNGHDLVERISRIASLVGIDAEASVSSDNSGSQPLIHVRAVGDYQQLVQLMMALVGKSKDLFILSLSMFAVDPRESEAGLEMDATFGVYL